MKVNLLTLSNISISQKSLLHNIVSAYIKHLLSSELENCRNLVRTKSTSKVRVLAAYVTHVATY